MSLVVFSFLGINTDMYVSSLINEIPQTLYVTAMAVLCVFVFFAIGIKGLKKGLYYSLALLLFEYMILVVCSTIVFREFNTDRGYELTPFWSYERPELMHENIMNVVMFVPIGILLGGALSWLGGKYWPQVVCSQS